MKEQNRYLQGRPSSTTIRCAGCNMEVMAYGGDRTGWKTLATPQGQMHFCIKQPCQQRHDEAVAGGQLAAAQSDKESATVQALRKRVEELEREVERLTVELDAKAPHTPLSSSESRVDEVVHVDLDGNGTAACGAEIGEVVFLEDLTPQHEPCDACTGVFAARQSQQIKEKKASARAPAQAPESAPAPEIELPAPAERVDYSKAPKLTPDLISRINDGSKPTGPILMTQSTFPSVDFNSIKPTQLRNSVAGFFKEYQVDTIEWAYDSDDKKSGIVFTLKPKESQ